MFFTSNLEELIYSKYQDFKCDELVIISGYISPSPLEHIATLPIEKITVIYGMYGSEYISPRLHDTFKALHNLLNINIMYSNVPVHTNYYLWKYKGSIIYALTGSVYFTLNSLRLPHEECLVEIDKSSYLKLNSYINQLILNSSKCDQADILCSNFSHVSCFLELYDPKSGEVPTMSGLNWGHSSKGHTKYGDGYITIRTNHIREYPTMFQPKPNKLLNTNEKKQKKNIVELIWDDGVMMDAQFEGSQPVNGRTYPKQICSYPNKDTIGLYFRNRIGVPPQDIVKITDLNRYGRSNVQFTLLQKGIYLVDFSV